MNKFLIIILFLLFAPTVFGADLNFPSDPRTVPPPSDLRPRGFVNTTILEQEKEEQGTDESGKNLSQEDVKKYNASNFSLSMVFAVVLAVIILFFSLFLLIFFQTKKKISKL